MSLAVAAEEVSRFDSRRRLGQKIRSGEACFYGSHETGSVDCACSPRPRGLGFDAVGTSDWVDGLDPRSQEQQGTDLCQKTSRPGEAMSIGASDRLDTTQK